jgi:hypothetical protein
MSYALLYDVPADEQMYRQVRAAIGDEQPEGLVAHLVLQTDDGLRHIGVWESQEDWQRFHDARVEPAVHTVLAAAGFTEMPSDPPVEELKLIDVWIGA